MRSQRILVGLKLYLLVALVGGMVVLSGPRPGPAEGAFPGANGKIAFGSNRDGNGEIYVMNGDGTGQANLTNNAAFDFGSGWSPDGSKIAFTSDRDGNFEVYVMNADGSGQTNLTNNPASDVGGTGWSPDGAQLTFTSNRDGNPDVYVMNADGSGVRQLTNNPAFDGGGRWSPNGSKIAFTSDRDEPNPTTCSPSACNFEIYVMNVDGSGQTNLTNNPAFDIGPAWAPDGSKIAFESRRDFVNNEIYVMNADGTGPANLTNNPNLDFAPAWSPDGSKIAFESDRDVNHEIYVMNADGSEQINLTNNAADDSAPNWQPLVGVGGIAELPRLAGGQAEAEGASLEADGSAGPGVAVLAGVSAAVAAGAVALGGAAWYARRRR